MFHGYAASFLRWVTDFGDLAVVLSVAAAVFAWLSLRRRWCAAAFWAGAIAGCGASTLAAKLALFARDPSWSNVGLENPSGHAAMSVVVYVSIAAMAGRRLQGLRGSMLPVLGAAAAVAIGVSRVLLRVHTPADVLVGLLIGTCWSWLFCTFGEPGRTSTSEGALPLLVLVAMSALTMHGVHLVPLLAESRLLSLSQELAARL